MKIAARSYPNIALIKYWGNRNNALRLPAADSLSMTLDSPSVDIEVDHSDVFAVRSFEDNGSEKTLTQKQIARLEKHVELTKEYLETLQMKDAIPASVSLVIRSAIPPSVGLASSAAVFSCLAKAYAELIKPMHVLSPREISMIARLGSGSAARSIFGGFSSLLAGSGDAIGASVAEQVADENHWMLYDIVIIPDHDEKKVGSTEGHELASTSPFFTARIEAIRTHRYQECKSAILAKDFEKLQAVTEEDALDMHHVMETSTPPLRYLSDDTRRIVREIEHLRKAEHLPVLYTMDAGPTVHLLCTEDAVGAIRSFAHAQKGCTVFETKVGKGAHSL